MNPLQQKIVELHTIAPELLDDDTGHLAIDVSNYLGRAQHEAARLGISDEVLKRTGEMAEGCRANPKIEFLAAVLYLSAQLMAICDFAIAAQACAEGRRQDD